MLPQIMDEFGAEYILNCDEARLYHRGLSDDRGHCPISMDMDGENDSSALFRKEKLFITRKSKAPRAFPKGHSKLPVHDLHSRSVWMAAEMFFSWQTSWHGHLRLKKRPTSLLLVSCSSHSTEVHLGIIRLFFFASNLSSRA